MVNEKEWEQFYFAMMPLASIALATAGLGVAVWGIISREPQGEGLAGLEPAPKLGTDSLSVAIPKVHYQDSQVLVEVRSPGEWHDIRDFIHPMDPRVQQIYHQVGPDAWALLDWVCRNIDYSHDNGEFWRFPSETIRNKSGDCDDTAILLSSLLLNFTDCYVAVGTYRGYGHAWGVKDSQILESTYTYARPVPDPQSYRTYALFNDREVIELWPGAMSQMFQLASNERHKLSLMAGAVRGAA